MSARRAAPSTIFVARPIAANANVLVTAPMPIAAPKAEAATALPTAAKPVTTTIL